MDIKINGCVQKFEMDSGSPVTILSRSDFIKLNLNTKIEKCQNIKLRAYNNTIICPVGVVLVNVQYHNIFTTAVLIIVNENLTPIVGRAWIRKLKIFDIDNINQTDILQMSDSNQTQIINDIFFKCSLKLKEGAQPIYLKPRPVPYS